MRLPKQRSQDVSEINGFPRSYRDMGQRAHEVAMIVTQDHSPPGRGARPWWK
jgi:hypothetical protein